MLLVTVAVLVSGLFGGLRRAPAPQAPVLQAGAAASVGPFELTVERVRWIDDLGEGAPTPTGRFLAVVATVRNTSDGSVVVGTLQEVLEPRDVDGLFTAVGSEQPAQDPADVKEEVLVIADGSRLTTLVPDLEYEVVVLYDQSLLLAPPTELGLQTFDLTYRQSSLDEQMLWTDPVDAGSGTFDVREGS